MAINGSAIFVAASGLLSALDSSLFWINGERCAVHHCVVIEFAFNGV